MSESLGHKGAEVDINSPVFMDTTYQQVDKKNPLMVTVVVDTIFNYLNKKDLKTCRLVNTLWNELTAPFLRRLCDLIYFAETDLRDNVRHHDMGDMAKFIECIDASANFPFSKLHITPPPVVKGSADEMLLNNFFLSVSSWVTSLGITDGFGPFFSQGLPNQVSFPVLKILNYKCLLHKSANFQFVTNILKSAPLIDKLRFSAVTANNGKEITCFINSIEKAECKQISSLEISGKFLNEHLTRLSQMGLQLKKLSLHFCESNIDTSVFKNFLECQSSTLVELKIVDVARSSSFAVEFPTMTKLRRFEIKAEVEDGICIEFPHISYVNQFPALRRLSLCDLIDEWDQFVNFDNRPSHTVQELVVTGRFIDRPEQLLLKAARLFPQIKKLEVPARLNAVHVVYGQMPNIEELILNTYKLESVDEIISGLTVADICCCEEVMDMSDNIFKLVEAGFEAMGTSKQLTCLKKLKILRLKGPGDPELTEVSCRLVLMKMNSLRCLDFNGRHPPASKISESILNEMKRKFIVLCQKPVYSGEE